MQQMQQTGIRQRGLRAAMTLVIAAAALGSSLSAQPAAARAPAQAIVPPGCVVNGIPLQPNLRAGQNWAWSFAANFDQPASTTQVRTCLALRLATSQTVVTYFQSNTHCVVMNNKNNLSIGSGRASFDGNMYLRCTLTLPGTWQVPPFAVETRTSFPSSATAATHTIFSATETKFHVSTQALSCVPTLQSTYGTATFVNNTAIGCAVESRLKSMLDRDPKSNLVHGWHRAGTTVYAKQQLALTQVVNPAVYVFDIGAQGDGPFVMDWIHVDPGNHSGQ